MVNSIIDKLENVEKRFESLNQEMARPEVAADFSKVQTLAQEQATIRELVTKYREYKATMKGLDDTRSLLNDSPDSDMVALAKDEIQSLEAKRETLLEDIKQALLPKDPADKKDVIVEIRAGTGGDEAGLFAAELYRMYTRYAETKGWKVEVITSSPGTLGGFKEMIFEVRGKGAFSRLKFERGVHRVQRVPVTESSGRIHTSTVTVAVLPEADEVEVKVDPNEIRIDIFHSGGAGGQNVNKVATAVRIVHLPTGIVTVCQDERSQLKNRQKAMAVLRARLLEQKEQEQFDEVTAERRAQVGTGERSEKIRTYNFPQGRVTDHRIGLTVHNLPGILNGDLDDLIDALATDDQARLLQEKLA